MIEPEPGPSPRGLSERLRLHRRVVRQDGRQYQVISLRNVDPVRFSVEPDLSGHLYPLIRSDLAGTRLLGRLLWGLSYQPYPNTVLVLDPGHVVGNPDDGGPSPIVVFGVVVRTVLSPALLRRLRQPGLWRSPSSGTVGWNTAGLPAALAERAVPSGAEPPVRVAEWPEAQVHPTESVVSVLAAPGRYRDWAKSIMSAGDHWYQGESCTEPAWGTSGIDVHAVRHFDRLVSTAAQARSEVLADGRPDPADLSRRVRERRELVSARHPGPWDAADTVR